MIKTSHTLVCSYLLTNMLGKGPGRHQGRDQTVPSHKPAGLAQGGGQREIIDPIYDRAAYFDM